MMRHELPAFRRVKRRYVSVLIHSVLSGQSGPALVELLEYDDHHFRAIFLSTYFQLPADRNEASKSQWNTLKKKLKRRNRSIFVFRAHGDIDCDGQTAEANCCYLDFGFMLH